MWDHCAALRLSPDPWPLGMALSVLPPWAWGGSYGVPEVLFLFPRTPVLPGQKRKATRRLSRAWDKPPLPAGIVQLLGERKERVEIQGQVRGDQLRAADARGSALLEGGRPRPCTSPPKPSAAL